MEAPRRRPASPLLADGPLLQGQAQTQDGRRPGTLGTARQPHPASLPPASWSSSFCFTCCGVRRRCDAAAPSYTACVCFTAKPGTFRGAGLQMRRAPSPPPTERSSQDARRFTHWLRLTPWSPFPGGGNQVSDGHILRPLAQPQPCLQYCTPPDGTAVTAPSSCWAPPSVCAFSWCPHPFPTSLLLHCFTGHPAVTPLRRIASDDLPGPPRPQARDRSLSAHSTLAGVSGACSPH